MKTVLLFSVILLFSFNTIEGRLICVGSRISKNVDCTKINKIDFVRFNPVLMQDQEKETHIYADTSLFFSMASCLFLFLLLLIRFREFAFLAILMAVLAVLYSKKANSAINSSGSKWKGLRKAKLSRVLGIIAFSIVSIGGLLSLILSGASD